MKKLISAILFAAVTVPAVAGTVERAKIVSLSLSAKSTRMIIETDRVINPECTGNTRQGFLDTYNTDLVARVQALLTAALLSGKSVTIQYAGCSESRGALIRRVTLNKY